MTYTIPAEAGWAAACLLDGATNLELIQPALEIPDNLRKPGPSYAAMSQEYGFRAMAPDKVAESNEIKVARPRYVGLDEALR